MMKAKFPNEILSWEFIELFTYTPKMPPMMISWIYELRTNCLPPSSFLFLIRSLSPFDTMNVMNWVDSRRICSNKSLIQTTPSHTNTIFLLRFRCIAQIISISLNDGPLIVWLLWCHHGFNYLRRVAIHPKIDELTLVFNTWTAKLSHLRQALRVAC